MNILSILVTKLYFKLSIGQKNSWFGYVLLENAQYSLKAERATREIKIEQLENTRNYLRQSVLHAKSKFKNVKISIF